MPVLLKQELDHLLPHEGDMCLLDAVRSWDADGIRCSARSHRDRTNPLRHAGHLDAICGLEYAAQAMAVHAGLVRAAEEARPIVGYLGGVRALELGVQRLDDIAQDLEIEATRLLGDRSGVMYAFRVMAGEKVLMSGRASIFFRYGIEDS
jgi:predicted hotdog family 3-hydroxylacyl-ACP dehydratase